MSERSRIIVPHRGLRVAKTRLAPVLAPHEREALAERLLQHVLGTIGRAGIGELVVISPDADLRPIVERSAGRLSVQRGMGLNSGLGQAREEALADGVTTLVVLHGDLPELSADDIAALVAALPERGVAIAPDAHGTGTNALALRPPGAIPFRFGRDSFAAHRREAEARDMALAVVGRPGLAFDLDTPADLASWIASGHAA